MSLSKNDLYQNDDLDMMTKRVIAKTDVQDFTYQTSDYPLYNWLRKSTAVPIKTDGSGYELEFYTDYGEADGGFYEGHEALQVGGLSGLNRGKLGWRRAYSGVSLFEVDIMANSGAAQVEDAVARAVAKAKAKIINTIAKSVMVPQAGTSLDSVYDALFTNNYAGIARVTTDATHNRFTEYAPTDTDNFFWHPNFETITKANVEAVPAAGEEGIKGVWALIKTMQRLIRHIKQTNMGTIPQIILCSEKTYEWIADRCSSKIEYFWPVKISELLDMGFDGLSFLGMPLTIDAQVADGMLVFLNNKYVGLVDNPRDNMNFTGWKDATDNTRSRQCKFYWTGNIFCTNPGGLGVLTITGGSWS